MNISATSEPITMKFYQKQYWDGGKAALGFRPDRIKTLVSMATDSSHRVIMEKTENTGERLQDHWSSGLPLFCHYTPRKLCLWEGILFSCCPSDHPNDRPTVCP